MDENHGTHPGQLRLAAGLVGLEGLVLVVLGLLEIVNVSSLRVTMGVTTSLFFLACGAALVAVAWGLTQAATWSRSPAVLAQLIQLGVAWGFRGGDTTPVAVVLALVALAALVAIFHPASTHALTDDPTREGSREG